MAKNNNGSAWALPCILVTTALVALLGFTTKGYTDWTFGLGTQEPPVSEEVPSTEEQPNSSEELPGTSEELPGTSEEMPSTEEPEIQMNQFINYKVNFDTTQSDDIYKYLNFPEDVKYTVDSSNSFNSSGISLTGNSLKITFENYTFDKVVINPGQTESHIKVNDKNDESLDGIYLLDKSTNELTIACSFSGFTITSLELSTQSLEVEDEPTQYTSYTSDFDTTQTEDLETFLNIDEKIKYTLDASEVIINDSNKLQFGANAYLKITFENLTFDTITFVSDSNAPMLKINDKTSSNFNSSTFTATYTFDNTNVLNIVAPAENRQIVISSFELKTSNDESADVINYSVNMNYVEQVNDVHPIDKVAYWGGLH